MRTLATYQLELQPQVEQSAQDCLLAVCEQLSHLVTQHYRGQKILLPPLTFDGRCREPGQGHRLLASWLAGGEHALASLDWELPADDPRFAWRISGTAAADSHTVAVVLRTQLGARSLRFHHFHTQVKLNLSLLMPTGLLTSLLSRWSGSVAGWPIPTTARLLPAEEVTPFVNGILLHPERVLPVVLLAPPDRFKSNPKAIQGLQNYLLGLGHVAELLNEDASKRLVAVLGRERALPVGVLRIYYPAFTVQAPVKDHPLWGGDQLQPEIKENGLHGWLHQKLTEHLASPFPEGPLLQAARAAVTQTLVEQAARWDETSERLALVETQLTSAAQAQEHFHAECQEARQQARSLQGKLHAQARSAAENAEQVQAVRSELHTCRQEQLELRCQYDTALQDQQQLQQTLVQTQQQLELLRDSWPTPPAAPAVESELEGELERAWQENSQYLTELEAARRELATVQAALHISQENLALLREQPGGRVVPAPAAVPAVPAPATVVEALQTAAERCADVLVCWDEAWRSAERSQFPGPSRVWQALQAIAEVGRDYFVALREGRALGPLEQAFARRVPFKYAPCESQMTLALYGEQRVFHQHGQSRQIQRHLTLGGGGVQNCLQIYFDLDEMGQRVIIAYCGRHLPYYRQR